MRRINGMGRRKQVLKQRTGPGQKIEELQCLRSAQELAVGSVSQGSCAAVQETVSKRGPGCRSAPAGLRSRRLGPWAYLVDR